MTEPLKVTVATIARFHSFEMARQLQKRDVLAAIYTGLARRFVRRYGIRNDLLRTYPWVQTPLEAGQRLGLVSPAMAQRIGRVAHRALDRHVASTLPDCHAYAALSGVGLRSGRAAQARNIAYVCIRSASHIAVQDRRLAREYAALGLPYAPISPATIDRELAEYDQADAVLVPSGFARDTFLEAGFPADRVFAVPFGVDIASFSRKLPRDPEFRVLFVGAPGVQKGLHYLLQAFAKAALPRARLAIVGRPTAETEILLKRFPVENLEMVGPVPHAEVARQMSRSSVLVLPSLNEGLANVQAEALGCECPVVASTNTGSRDLFTDGDEGFIVPVGDVDALADRLTRLHDDPAFLDEMSHRAAQRMRRVGGWDSYGDGICDLFLRLARARGHDVRLAGADC